LHEFFAPQPLRWPNTRAHGLHFLRAASPRTGSWFMRCIAHRVSDEEAAPPWKGRDWKGWWPMSSIALSDRDHPQHHDAQSAGWALAEYEKKEHDRATHLKRRHLRYHVAGRVLLASLFLFSAVAKTLQFDTTWRTLNATFGLDGSGALLLFAITIELVGGAMLLLGYQTRWASLGLVFYVAMATAIFHHDLTVDLNRAFALANLAIAGGLLLLVSHGAGQWSIDNRQLRRDPNAVLPGP
jgi:putative oxidoreductase